MATTEGAPAPAREVERIPFMQRMLDNPFLLLFLGVTVARRALHAVGRDGSRLDPAGKVTIRT